MKLDRSIIPQPTGDIKFNPPQIKDFMLSNGLRVLFVQKEHLPIIKLKLIANSGSFFDPHDKKGLAHLLSLTIDEGAGNYNALELSEEFEVLGSSFSINCNHDNVSFSLSTLTENFERSLELLSTIITNPHFKEEDFHRERRKVEVRLLQIKDDPEELASQAFTHVIHGKNSPYAFPNIGTEKSIQQIEINDIRSFYEKYLSPHSSTLITVGNISEYDLIELLEKYFSSWQKEKKSAPIILEQIKRNHTYYILHKEGSVQTEIRIGHISSKRSTSDYFAKTIMNLILGGQFSSRINLNLREAKGFTYGANSNFWYYKHAGEFCVSTSVALENTVSAVEEILFELENIHKGVTDDEIRFAKSSLIKNFPLRFESYSQIASNLSLLAIHDLPLNYFNYYLENINRVSIEEINAAAVNNIKVEELSIVLVGEKDRLMNDFQSKNFSNIKFLDDIS